MKNSKKILLIGGRSKAKSLAISLRNQGHKILIINKNKEDCMMLAEINGVTVVNGDGTKNYVLEDAGANECDICIALTSKDEDNLVACQLCKRQFNIQKTVAIVSDPNKTEFFQQMGIDNVVCAVAAVTSIIEHTTFIEEITNIISIGKGKAKIMELYINQNSPAVEKRIWEIELPKEVIIGCILRDDMTLIPRGDTRILVGDVLVVISGNKQEELNAIKVLAGR